MYLTLNLSCCITDFEWCVEMVINPEYEYEILKEELIIGSNQKSIQ
jgi:hypothetical protein